MTLFIVSHPHGPVKKFLFWGAMAAALCALQFPVRRDTIALHQDRKLFANCFLPGMTPLRFITTGNFFANRFPISVYNNKQTIGLWPVGNLTIEVHVYGKESFP